MDKKFATTNSLLELSKKLLKNDKCVKDVIDTKLDEKVDKVVGKGLSTNDLTDELKTNYDKAVTDSHTHINKSVIDTITTEKVSSWDNKSEFDGNYSSLSEIPENIATTDYVNGEISTLNAAIDKQKTFVAVKGETSFSEIQEAYNAKKMVLCTDGWLVTKLDIFAPDNYAQFSGLDNQGNPALLSVTKGNDWTRKNITNVRKDTTDYLNERIEYVNATVTGLGNSVGSIGAYINGKDSLLSALSNMNTVDILKSVYNFRGGFRDNAGTLHIKNPGIYLVIAGGTNNKQIIINQKGAQDPLLSATWNGIIVLAYESGAVTPIGIKSALTIAEAFKLPGTFQGWTSDGKYSTTINYPAKCVVAYLGNSNVNYLE